jgi:hypothetical protein
MKAFPSYSNNSSIKCEGCFAYDSNCQECGKLNARFPKNNVEIVEIEESGSIIDFTQDRFERRAARKEKVKKRKNISRDPVKFVDLPVTSNYDDYLENCFSKKLNLNHKSPLANLHYTFKTLIGSEDTGIRKVVNCRHKFLALLLRHMMKLI